jgi:hypothetical protein
MRSRSTTNVRFSRDPPGSQTRVTPLRDGWTGCVEDVDVDGQQIVGVSSSVREGHEAWPLHGLRHPPTSTTSGWYVWTGDLSQEDDFFGPWHVSHLISSRPQVAHLLDLPPGTRFVVAPDYEDVWEDPSLLDV